MQARHRSKEDIQFYTRMFELTLLLNKQSMHMRKQAGPKLVYAPTPIACKQTRLFTTQAWR